jgi:hypothetical protein
MIAGLFFCYSFLNFVIRPSPPWKPFATFKAESVIRLIRVAESVTIVNSNLGDKPSVSANYLGLLSYVHFFVDWYKDAKFGLSAKELRSLKIEPPVEGVIRHEAIRVFGQGAWRDEQNFQSLLLWLTNTQFLR